MHRTPKDKCKGSSSAPAKPERRLSPHIKQPLRLKPRRFDFSTGNGSERPQGNSTKPARATSWRKTRRAKRRRRRVRPLRARRLPKRMIWPPKLLNSKRRSESEELLSNEVSLRQLGTSI